MEEDNGMILLVLGSTGLGILLGLIRVGTPGIFDKGLVWSLAFLIFVVGWEMGSELEMVKRLLKRGPRLLLVPLFSVAGSVVFGMFAGFLLDITPIQGAVVASGMGWYSFTGSFLSAQGWTHLGAVAFAANVLRELFTILFAPLLSRVSPIAPVASGGATSMDSTLGVVRVFSGREMGPVSFLNGFVTTLLVPPITYILSRLL
ncbi:MAG TPA: hypothetical protein DHV12_03115 [Thermotogae bacterium]|nr:hypothetical protein [Thermotogota bacterium]